ncbi:hypothetical protein BHE74_00041834 [Ensete ventricosum]|nr:hypothetical protein BHE74_00041834 [Ensete ventricosum]
MEKGKASEQPGILLAELARLQELAREMEAEHGRHSPDEFSRSLLQELLVSIEKAICMAKPTTPDINPQPADGDSPRSSGESSRSETSKLAFREQMSKKRKKLPEWTREVLVSAGAGPVDDGHSWRKYGQKGILGSKHPSLKGEGGGGIQESGNTGANSASDSPAAVDMDLMLQDLDFESDFSSFFS